MREERIPGILMDRIGGSIKEKQDGGLEPEAVKKKKKQGCNSSQWGH